MKSFISIVLAAGLLACSGPAGDKAAVETAADETFQPDAYIVSNVPGSAQQRAERRTADGVLLEEGFMQNGRRTGTWVEYHPNSAVPKKITSYIDDRLNGIYLEFNDRGYLDLRASYRDNLLDGAWARYQFGRPLQEAFYVNGKLDGIVREYVMNTGKLQKEVSYRNGLMDGPFRFYNDQGQVTLEYQYSKGEKVGGGIVDPTRPNEPR